MKHPVSTIEDLRVNTNRGQSPGYCLGDGRAQCRGPRGQAGAWFWSGARIRLGRWCRHGRAFLAV